MLLPAGRGHDLGNAGAGLGKQQRLDPVELRGSSFEGALAVGGGTAALSAGRAMRRRRGVVLLDVVPVMVVLLRADAGARRWLRGPME